MNLHARKSRPSWSGQLAFILAAAASAIGLGNVWRFPYLAAQYGGGLFLLIYVLMVVTLGFTLMTTEVAIGRRTRLSGMEAFSGVHRGWKPLGWLVTLIPVIIVPYYCVIGGWILKYIFAYLFNRHLALEKTVETVSATGEPVVETVTEIVHVSSPDFFSAFIAHPWQPAVFGSVFILFSMWLCGRRNKVPFMWLCDRLTIISTIGGAIVRLGNFFNSEIIGVETDVPWGVKFVRLYPGVPVESIPARHPAQLYEALCYLAIFVLLWILYKRTSAPRRFGLIAGIGLIGMFTMRFIIEFIKVEQVDFEKGMILDMGQLLSIPTVLLGVCFVWYALKHQPFDLEHVAAVNRKWVEEQSKARAKGEKKGKKR